MIRAQVRDLLGYQQQAVGAISTVAAAAALALSPVDRVTVLRYDSGSSYAPANYKRVSSQPTRPVGYENAGWFQSADGGFFEIEPDTGTGRYECAAFGDDIAGVRQAQAVSKRLQGRPGYLYTLPTTGGTVITANADEDVDIDFEGSGFVLQTNCVAFLVSHSTFVSEHAVTLIDGKVLTVPGGVGTLAKGDVLKMGDLLTPIWWNQGVARKGTYLGRATGEHIVVGAATGTTLTLVGAPEWSIDRIPEYLRKIMRTDISNVANNGNGLCRVTTSHPHYYETGLNIAVESVTGTTEANGTRPVNVINSTTFDIVGSTFTNAYVSGGTARLSCTYSTHATAALKVGKMRDTLFRIRVNQILCAPSVTTHTRIIKFSNKKNIDVKLPYIQKSAGMIVSPISCYGGRLEYYADGSGPGNTGYITTISGCTGLNVFVDGSGTTRHTVDGGSASSNDGVGNPLVECGPSSYVNVYINGGNLGSTEAAHATHAGTYRWNWYVPKARQTTGNVVVRGVGHTVFGGRSTGAGQAGNPDDPDDTTVDAGAFVSFCQFYVGVVAAANNGSGAIRLQIDGRAGRGPNLATGLKVEVTGATGASAASTNGIFYITKIDDTHIDLDGSTFSSATGSGNAVLNAGFDAADNFTIMDTAIDDSPGRMASNRGNGGTMTISGGVWRSIGSADSVISSSRVLEIRGHALAYTGNIPPDRVIFPSWFCEKVDIDGWRIDANSTVGPIVDLFTGKGNVLLLMQGLRVYNPNGAVASLFKGVDGNTLPATGSQIGNVTVYGDLTTLVAGYSMADSITALQGIGAIVGPIVANGEKIADAPDA